MLDTRAEFLLEGMKAQRDEGGRRILLGDRMEGGAVMLRPIRFQSPLSVHVQLTVCVILPIPTCAGPFGAQLLC
jgi:hypothetical protein